MSCSWTSNRRSSSSLQSELEWTGLKIATNTVAFATKFFPFATKISGEVANLQLIFPLLFQNKRVTSNQVAATLIKIKKEITILFCFLLRIYFQSEDTSVVK